MRPRRILAGRLPRAGPAPYSPSSLLDVDFAVTEHIGRFQVGPAGFYVFQTGMDRQNGIVVPPDGRRLEYMAVGGVVNYDMAEYNAAIKFKANATVFFAKWRCGKALRHQLCEEVFLKLRKSARSQFWQASLAPHAPMA